MAFHDLPTKRRITAVIMLTSITALLFTTAVFMVYDLISYRRELVRNLGTTAAFFAESSTAMLAFPHETEAEAMLATLHANKHIVAAAFYNNKNELFVHYPADLSLSSFPVVPSKAGPHPEKGYVSYFLPVKEDDRWYGTVYLKSDLTALRDRLRLYAGMAILVLIASALVAFGISNALQRTISAPILTLADTAKVISERRDYSVRAPKSSRDEIGLLTDGFNQMLTRIQEQTVALRESEERLRLALEASYTGIWDWNIKANRVAWDEHTDELFGLKR